MNRSKAILFLATASILWSIGGLFIKIIDWHPLAIAGSRSLVAMTVMSIYLKKTVFSVKLTKYKVLGALANAALVILFVSANKLTTSANAILLQFTAPVWVIIFNGLFKGEPTSRRDKITVAFVMAGMVLFFMGDLSGGKLIGNILAILSGMAFALWIIIVRLEPNHLEINLLGNFTTFLVGIPFYFIATGVETIGGILILGIFQLGIANIFFLRAVKGVSAVEATIIPVLEPLLNPVWVFLVTAEAPSSYAIVGGIAVVATIVWRNIIPKRKSRVLI